MIGIGVLAVLVIIWAASRANKKQSRQTRPSRPRPPQAPAERDRTADVIGGWMLGHQIAKGHHGFPGDPLPGGHLGSPQDLAFWGGIFDDDEFDDDDADDDFDSDED